MPDKARKIKKPFQLSPAAEILESISDSFYALDREWRYSYVNQRGASLLNVKPEDLIGQNIWEKFPELIGTEIEAAYRRVMQERQPQEFESQGIFTEHWFSVRVYPSKEGISVYRLDITERKKVEERLRQSEKNLLAELDIAQQLQKISLQLIQADKVEILYDLIVDTVMAVLHADFASFQILYPERGELRLFTHRGFTPQAAKFWTWVRPDSHSPCGVVLRTGQRSVVPDVEKCDFMAGSEELKVCLQTGIRAVQTSPLISRSGALLGVLSTHWRQPYQPTGGELRFIDVLGRQAADVIERKRAGEALTRAKDELEIRVAERTFELAEANHRLQQYGLRITQVQEEERKRIAYELHDDTAQYLSILKMEIESLIHSGKIQDSEVLSKLEFLRTDAERAFNDVRRYSHELRPGVLEHLGLQAALEQIVDDINKLKQVPIETSFDGQEPVIPEPVKLAFFRIAQEALNNARKHARASKVNIELKFDPAWVWMQVSDNGVGFIKTEAYASSASRGSLGLMSMLERARLVNADLKIESAPGQGTRVILEARL